MSTNAPPGHRRDEGDDVAVPELGLEGRVLLVHRVEQPLRLLAEVEGGPHVRDAVGVDLALRPAGTLTQAREEPHRHTHAK